MEGIQDSTNLEAVRGRSMGDQPLRFGAQGRAVIVSLGRCHPENRAECDEIRKRSKRHQKLIRSS